MAAVPIVPHDPEVIETDMCELWASGAIAHRPYAARGGFEALVDTDIATRIELDTGRFESDAVSIRRTPRRHQDVTGIDGALAMHGSHMHANPRARAALHIQDLRIEHYLDTFVLE